MSGILNVNKKRKPSGASFRKMSKQKKEKSNDCIASCLKLESYFKVKVCNFEN